MPQDSGQEPEKTPELGVGQKILDEIKAEPVPDKIVELATRLDGVLAAKHKAAKDTPES